MSLFGSPTSYAAKNNARSSFSQFAQMLDSDANNTNNNYGELHASQSAHTIGYDADHGGGGFSNIRSREGSARQRMTEGMISSSGPAAHGNRPASSTTTSNMMSGKRNGRDPLRINLDE